jgi:acetolactate synthase-1/2/3 large subunit
MSAGELETLARLDVPAVLIHFNNGCFGWIKALQALHSKGKFMSVDFGTGNMARVAEGFGLKALHAESPEELEEGLDEAFATQAPVFLDVVTESETTELPPVYSWLTKAKKEREETLP